MQVIATQKCSKDERTFTLSLFNLALGIMTEQKVAQCDPLYDVQQLPLSETTGREAQGVP